MMNESDFLQAISSRGVFEDPLHETSLPADNAAAGAFKNTQGKGPNRHWPLVDGDHLAPDHAKAEYYLDIEGFLLHLRRTKGFPSCLKDGAGEGNRTGDVRLGKSTAH